MFKKITCLLALALGFASATDVYVPNTAVSYNLTKDPIDDKNTSSVYVDDASTDTYVEFNCQKGKMVFYLNTDTNIITQDDYDNDAIPTLTYRVDSQTAKTIPMVLVESDTDSKNTAHLRTLLVEDKNDALMLTAFKSATSKVVMRITNKNKSQKTFTFATKGFSQGLAKLNTCK